MDKILVFGTGSVSYALYKRIDIQKVKIVAFVNSDSSRKSFEGYTVIMPEEIKHYEYDYVLIPDVRFPNEIDKMKENFDCISIRLTRPNFDNGLTSEQKEHISETALDNYIGFNCRIINDGSLSELKQMLKNFTERELGV